MTDKPTTDDKERTMIEASLGMEHQVGSLRITQLGRFELKAGDVLWIKADTLLSTHEEKMAKEILSRLLPKGVEVIFVHGMRPVAVHREADKP